MINEPTFQSVIDARQVTDDSVKALKGKMRRLIQVLNRETVNGVDKKYLDHMKYEQHKDIMCHNIGIALRFSENVIERNPDVTEIGLVRELYDAATKAEEEAFR